jgi:hypothetical protein
MTPSTADSPAPEAAPLAAAFRAERRSQSDRRARPTRVFDALRGWRSRSHSRRAGDQPGYFDVFARGDIALLLAIFALNLLDAGLTLLHMSLGGSEANPIMAWLLGVGEWAFLGTKCFFVAAWLLLLTIHKSFALARLSLWMLLTIFGGVLVIHAMVLLGPM